MITIANAEPIGEGMVAVGCTFTESVVFPEAYVKEHVVLELAREGRPTDERKPYRT